MTNQTVYLLARDGITTAVYLDRVEAEQKAAKFNADPMDGDEDAEWTVEAWRVK